MSRLGDSKGPAWLSGTFNKCIVSKGGVLAELRKPWLPGVWTTGEGFQGGGSSKPEIPHRPPGLNLSHLPTHNTPTLPVSHRTEETAQAPFIRGTPCARHCAKHFVWSVS